jgi:hypothetical protein
MPCRAPSTRRRARGDTTLAIDLVEEGATWFSRAGARLLKVDFTVR